MSKPKRVFIVADIKYKDIKMFVDQIPKLSKGFIRLGHDVRIFSYCSVLQQMSPLKSRNLTKLLYKSRVDELLVKQVKSYQPHIVFVDFPRVFDAESIKRMRKVAPNAVYIGDDGDPWPKLKKNRIETAKELDILKGANDGEFLQDYRDAGVPNCVFMPCLCDPDNDHRYEVSEKWKSDVLWTGTQHHGDSDETFRRELIEKLAQYDKCTMYGCCGRPKIGGFNYLYAISGARIGVSVNGVNSVRLYHSDRITHYLSCGTCVLAKRVPDSDLLFRDGQHLRYFDSVEHFFELADWYLNHEKERKKIADSGMQWAHEQLNCVKMAGYVLELAEKGTYNAPWFQSSE